jgi:hypothetical protein
MLSGNPITEVLTRFDPEGSHYFLIITFYPNGQRSIVNYKFIKCVCHNPIKPVLLSVIAIHHQVGINLIYLLLELKYVISSPIKSTPYDWGVIWTKAKFTQDWSCGEDIRREIIFVVVYNFFYLLWQSEARDSAPALIFLKILWQNTCTTFL